MQKIERGDPTSRPRLRRVADALGLTLPLPIAVEDEELAAIRERLRDSGLPESELDIAARSILASRRNTAKTTPGPSPAGKQVVGEREGA